MKARNLPKNVPIVVVGAGIMGLLSTYELTQQGYTNIRVIAESFENLTSHKAESM